MPEASSQEVYFYDVEAGSCIELASTCVTNSSCKFDSQTDCVARCVAAGDVEEKDGVGQGGCEGTQAGCCPDGSPRPRNGKCCEFLECTRN